MLIIDYFASEDKKFWRNEIRKSDWGVGQFLYKVLENHTLTQLCGESTKVLMLTDDKRLISYCTLAEQDDVRDISLTPWIGFVYTFPKYRGQRHMSTLLKYVENIAIINGAVYVYISTNEIGLYEKIGYTFYKVMKDCKGKNSNVYRKLITFSS